MWSSDSLCSTKKNDAGVIEYLAPAGRYNIDEVVLRVRDHNDGRLHQIKMYRRLPIRRLPRHVRLPLDTPFHTGSLLQFISPFVFFDV